MPAELNQTRQEYIQRINYVLDFVEKNLDEDLSLKKLAKKAHYSAFHFHRIFSAIVGETLNRYINRKRIERIASILLVDHSQPVKDLAYQYGFTSESSFSRSFKKYYGISPTAFKSEGKNRLSKIGIEALTLEKYICSIENLKIWMDMNAKISVQELEEIKLAGIMHIGEFEEMANMFQRLLEWGEQNELLGQPAFKALTLYHDNPNVTPHSKIRYSTCITVDREIKAEGEIRPLILSKGLYAVGQYEIEAKDFSKAWESLCIWVIENGYKFKDGEYFEVYHNQPKADQEQVFLVDIYIPLERTEKLKLGLAARTPKKDLATYRKQINRGEIQKDYGRLMNYIKQLRNYFRKEYASDYTMGSLYQGNMDYSYISLTTQNLKKLKLKFVIIFNHRLMRFEICLSGQNKKIRRQYWELFKGSDWNSYHLAESIDDSLSIIDHVIVENPDFDNPALLTEQIDTGSREFIDEIRAILE